MQKANSKWNQCQNSNHRVSVSRHFLCALCKTETPGLSRVPVSSTSTCHTSNPLTIQRGHGSLKTKSNYLKHALPLITLSAMGPSLLDMTQTAQIKMSKTAIFVIYNDSLQNLTRIAIHFDFPGTMTVNCLFPPLPYSACSA